MTIGKPIPIAHDPEDMERKRAEFVRQLGRAKSSADTVLQTTVRQALVIALATGALIGFLVGWLVFG